MSRAVLTNRCLLGLQPEEPDSELGYIVPGESNPFGARTVARFVEKPELPVAAQIVRAGGLWNTFIIAASARALLNLYLPRFAPLSWRCRSSSAARFSTNRQVAGRPSLICIPGCQIWISPATCWRDTKPR